MRCPTDAGCTLPVQVCIRLPVLDGDEEADCASIGVSSRDDGGGGAAYSIVNAGDECIVLFGVLCLVKDKFSIYDCICIQASIFICISISISICICGDELSVSDTTGSVWQRAPQDK